MKTNHYYKLLGMLGISFMIMYSVMFLNVDSASHIYLSATRLYMTLLMVSPMAILMMLMMPSMYNRKLLNKVILILSAGVFSIALILLREQGFIGDKQYMQAMIPHHSSAILTSKNAMITDREVKELSLKIIESQEQEIAQMKEILQRMNNK